MVDTRIGSLALINDTLRDVSSSQTRLADLQQQISSGLKSRDFAGLNGSVEQFTQVNGQIERAQQFAINNRLNISKLQTTVLHWLILVSLPTRLKTPLLVLTVRISVPLTWHSRYRICWPRLAGN
jgi:Flagellin and related hook-associated proteins